jgi:hypothetical protein
MYDSGVSGGGEVELQDGLVAWDELRGDGRLSDGGPVVIHLCSASVVRLEPARKSRDQVK